MPESEGLATFAVERRDACHYLAIHAMTQS